MAADGTKTMTAKLSVKADQEMKTDIKKWVYADAEIKKIFNKPIVYQEKIDLNPKKWNAAKLSKAMTVFVRPELQLLAQRVGDLKKDADKAKSPKEHNKILTALKKARTDVTGDIEEKVSEALEELASGKGEAKAGIALGKKAMAKVSSLNATGVIKKPVDMAVQSLKDFIGAKTKNDDAKATSIMKKAQKDVEAAQKDLAGTAKDAQNIAKFLLSTGKKLKDNEIGQLANFGKEIMAKDVQSVLDKLDTVVEQLEDALADYGSDLKKEALTDTDAKTYLSTFKSMESQQKTANTAVDAMKKLEKTFKTVEKDLK